ncbi:MAG: hypothetical protein EOO43_21560 [Flavobacterium sp.]|nr:MAG: hypothetical protein EOO43_21560 [Flavobacterium sp.]
MTLDKVLILDDKLSTENFSSVQAISLLDEEQRSLIDYYEETVSLWSESTDGDDIVLLQDFSRYPFIFIHDSFENPLVKDGLKAILFEKLTKTSKVVLFSGSRSESETPIEKIYDEKISGAVCYEILRRQYFDNLKNFIDGYLLISEYDIRYLYNQYLQPKKEIAYLLLEKIKMTLEESIQAAIASDSFKDLLSLYEYDADATTHRFSMMTDDDFIATLEDLIEEN